MSGIVLPISFSEVLSLPALGIAQSDIVFKNVSLSSSKFIIIREEGKSSVAIVDTATKNILRLPVAVDGAIMNPLSKVVALRAGGNLQIYNLEMKTKMKTTTVKEGENVVYWKWLDNKTIAIVTESSVFHWSMDGDAAPQKIFDRAPHDGQFSAKQCDEWDHISSASGIALCVLTFSSFFPCLSLFFVLLRLSRLRPRANHQLPRICRSEMVVVGWNRRIARRFRGRSAASLFSRSQSESTDNGCTRRVLRIGDN